VSLLYFLHAPKTIWKGGGEKVSKKGKRTNGRQEGASTRPLRVEFDSLLCPSCIPQGRQAEKRGGKKKDLKKKKKKRSQIHDFVLAGSERRMYSSLAAHFKERGEKTSSKKGGGKGNDRGVAPFHYLALSRFEQRLVGGKREGGGKRKVSKALTFTSRVVLSPGKEKREWGKKRGEDHLLPNSPKSSCNDTSQKASPLWLTPKPKGEGKGESKKREKQCIRKRIEKKFRDMLNDLIHQIRIIEAVR